MKRYHIKSQFDKVEYFDILEETEEGYRIRLTRISDGNENIFEETMPEPLFTACLNSGYIFEAEQAISSVA
ncbi:MAG: hypothetical protein LBU28_06390 [Spirochaetaceae bacterium]|jgi:hypothetical protein|nr:hypothetical protein [Spirochaetaceae bacterium]